MELLKAPWKLAGVSVFPAAAATAPDMYEFVAGN